MELVALNATGNGPFCTNYDEKIMSILYVIVIRKDGKPPGADPGGGQGGARTVFGKSADEFKKTCEGMAGKVIQIPGGYDYCQPQPGDLHKDYNVASSGIAVFYLHHTPGDYCAKNDCVKKVFCSEECFKVRT